MKRLVVVAIAILLVSCSAISGVSAAPLAPGVANQDTYVSLGDSGSNFDGQYLKVGTSPGACSSTGSQSETSFLRWDMQSAIGQNVTSAQMTFSILLNLAAGATQLTLYRVADDGWGASTLTYDYPTAGAGGPALGTAIQTIDVPAGYTGLVTFGAASPTSSDLATYVKGQLVQGDGKASFALRVTNCPDAADQALGVTILLNDSEHNDPVGSAPNLTTQTTTAVTLRTLHAFDSAVNWPLIFGLGVVALVVIGGLAMARRRAAAH